MNRAALFVLAALLSTSAWSQEGKGEGDLRSAVQNPISSLISLPFTFTFDYDAANGDATILNINPVVPVTVGDWILVNRAVTSEKVEELIMVGPAEPIDLQSRLLKKLQDHAREIGREDMPGLTREKLQELDHRGEFSYLFQVATDLDVKQHDGPGPWSELADPPLYRFALYGQGSLVRVVDNTVVRSFKTAQEETNPKSVDEWTAENRKLIGEELELAQQRLAEILIARL